LLPGPDTNEKEARGLEASTADVVGFLACSNAKPKGFDTQRRDFMGTYGDFSNPRAVASGEMNDSIAWLGAGRFAQA